MTAAGHNKPESEVVRFSAFVTKINRRNKSQQRVMLITDKAIYNLLPGNYGKCKRRIGIESLASVTVSRASDEFVLHVPEEYDYRFSSPHKDTISRLLYRLYESYLQRLQQHSGATPAIKVKSPKLHVAQVKEENLRATALTKVQARYLTREDIAARKRELLERKQEDEADMKEETDCMDADFTQLEGMEDKLEKVSMSDFKLLKVLGRGSFGKVMQVQKITDGKVYAMKILKKRAIMARNQVEHTKAERRILETIHHPFLMRLRYAFQNKEKLYFVLDYYNGGELFFHLKNRKKFSEETARIYIGEIALALGELHSHGIIYRDLKPENVLLDEQGHVCLTDFGLAKDLKPGEKAHTFCGTPEYLAPEIVTEIVTGAGHDKAVDWWSLGILLYELTVGIPPFYSNNVNDMYTKIQHGVLRFPQYLSQPCKSLIIGLLNRDPTRRLGSQNDVEDIKSHPFFGNMCWDKLYRKEIHPPYRPKIKGSQDTGNFDVAFTRERVIDTPLAPNMLVEDSEDPFAHQFTYDPRAANGMLQDF